MSDDTDKLLAERGKTHGDWNDTARIFCRYLDLLNEEIERCGSSIRRNHGQYAALVMEAMKRARMISGNSDEAEHWDDSEGYLRLGNKSRVRSLFEDMKLAGVEPEKEAEPVAHASWGHMEKPSETAQLVEKTNFLLDDTEHWAGPIFCDLSEEPGEPENLIKTENEKCSRARKAVIDYLETQTTYSKGVPYLVLYDRATIINRPVVNKVEFNILMRQLEVEGVIERGKSPYPWTSQLDGPYYRLAAGKK